jgi:DNA polymerase-3 subunit gamma/tau
MVEQAARLGPATLVRYGEILHAGLIEMRGATAPRLLLELLCARMLLPAASTGEPALLERLERIERRASIAPAPVPHGESAAAPPPGPDATQSGAARRTFVRSRRAGNEPLPEGATPPARGTDVAGASGSRVSEERAEAGATDHVERPEPVHDAVSDAPNGAAVQLPERAEVTRPRADPAPDVGEAAPWPAPVPADDRAPVPPVELASQGRSAGRPAAQPVDHPTPQPPGEPAVPTSLDAAAVRRVWSEILAAAKQRSRSTGALMVNATVRAVDGDVLVLTIGSEPLARRLSEQRNTDVIADALHAVLGVRWRVRCDHGDAAPAAARPAGSRTSAPPQRPSRPAPPRPAPTRRSAPDDGEPLPPEPPDEEVPPEDEEAMMAQAAADAAAPTVRRDPEEVAIELLSAQLGATAIERR